MVESGENLMMDSVLLSQESKVAMGHLFMQYPPVLGEFEHLKSSACSNKPKRSFDKSTFFCKPLMTPDEMKKKAMDLSSKLKNGQLAKINEQRSRLPITSSRDMILSEIDTNQVVLISGETGCGKTTQVPQFILDKMWESGNACKIMCTQPRRMSATSVAERVSEERGEVVGDTVGYKIRLESRGGRHSSVVFCTNGILLQLLVSDGHAGSDPSSSSAATSCILSQLTHIVVDEIHERDHYCDFMLSIIRDMLPRYPHLRLVLMSATMDGGKFSQYFGGCPVIKVPGFTFPVKTFYLEDILYNLNSPGENHVHSTLPSDDKAIRKHLTASSDPFNVDIDLIEQLLLRICTDSNSGAILIFFPGWDAIEGTMKRLNNNPIFKDPSKFLLLILHSRIESDEQKRVFKRPPHGCRKIILSTNIAETAVTIDDVVYVVETGRVKESNYDPTNNVSTLKTSWVSKASSRQRAGRAGRCQPGVCYYLYTELQAASLSEFQAPEIQRIPLEELCLQVKMLDPNYDIVKFLNKTLDPPANETVRNAVAVLIDIGALSTDENLTELGKKLVSLPVHPLLSKMLFFAILFKCLDPALTLACAAYYRDPFIIPRPDSRKDAAKAKAELAALYGGHSDQLAVVAALEGWIHAQSKSKFCSQNFVSYPALNMLSKMRKQLLRELQLNGYVPRDTSTCNIHAHDLGILHALLVAGLYPRIGLVCPPRRGTNFSIMTANEDYIRVNPRSTYTLGHLKESNDLVLAVYGELFAGDRDIQARKCSIIGEIPLALLAKEISVAPIENDVHGHVKNEESAPSSSDISMEGKLMSSAENPVELVVDRWLSFRSTALEVAQIYYLRQRLSAAISLKGTEPRIWLPPALAASIDAITFVFTHDGLPKMLPNTQARRETRREPKRKTQAQIKRETKALKRKAKAERKMGLSVGSSQDGDYVTDKGKVCSQDGDYVTDKGKVFKVRVSEGKVSVTQVTDPSSPSATKKATSEPALCGQSIHHKQESINRKRKNPSDDVYVTDKGQGFKVRVSEGKVSVTQVTDPSSPSATKKATSEPALCGQSIHHKQESINQ